ncbi:MAG: ABC-2 family transporter protein, partial [Myxococcota bacterium]|nr:ABC-2 family transporter protein [Myxococcota bacterium]
MPQFSTYRGPPATTVAKWLRLVGARLKVRMSYPVDLLVGALGDLLLAGIGVAFLAALFHQVPDIRGWTWAEVLLTWGLAEVCCGVFFIVFQGLWVFNQRYVLRGELDRVLLRPLHPLGQVLVDNLKLEGLAAVGIGVCMVGVALGELPSLHPVQWLMLPLVVAGGVAVLGGVLTGV